MPDPISTLAIATGGAFLSKFVGPAAEHLGKLALERAQQLGAKATALLSAVGREPQSVEPKLIMPMVQAAALEPDPSLADKWAALLANSADPAQRMQVRSAFTDVLRQLTVDEARIVDYLYHGRTRITVYDKLEPESIYTKGIDSKLGLSPEDVAVAIDNLIRLRLCELPLETMAGGISITTNSPHFRVIPTIFGQFFYEACTPPRL